MKIIVLCFCLLMLQGIHAQTIPQKLAKAVQQLEADPQMRHAIISLCVIDAATGKRVYAHNEQTGLAPASTQKIFTSAAALELLGKEYRYRTSLGYAGSVKEGVLTGNLYVIGSGDPSFGSWRWKETADSVVLSTMVQQIRKAGITKFINGLVTVNESTFDHQYIPGGWIWDDIGNYYGAGAYYVNWRENQYDMYLQSGDKAGDSVKITGIQPKPVFNEPFVNGLATAAKGTGDNAYIYFGISPDRNSLVKGTIPAGERSFSISGATPDPVASFINDLQHSLESNSIYCADRRTIAEEAYSMTMYGPEKATVFYTWQSPSLDTLNYWFLRKSINLYGEAFIKTLALQKKGLASTENGTEVVQDFWSAHGIDKAAINIIDGSGLSPQNRVTTDAEVKVLQYARTRPWYSSFYNALPEYNGMKMKSGSIGGARAFAGYHTAKNGKEYIFSIIVNNYDGSSGNVVKKMYTVLDVLK